MPLDTFVWDVRVGDTGTVKFRARGANLGDGYEQKVGDGINGKSANWPVKIIGTIAEIKPITDFLDAHGGYIPFLWTPPYGEQAAYLCAGYTPQRTAGQLVTLTATFEQTFALGTS